MYSQTKGIVLSSVKYRENSIICKIYTARLGLQSYLVNGAKKKKGGGAYYQALNILDLTVYHKNNKLRSELHIKASLFMCLKVVWPCF